MMLNKVCGTIRDVNAEVDEKIVALNSLEKKFKTDSKRNLRPFLLQTKTVTAIVNNVQNDNEDLQIAALSVVIHVLCTGEGEDKLFQEIMSSSPDLVTELSKLVLSENEEVRELAIWALETIAQDFGTYRDKLWEARVITSIVNMLNDLDPSLNTIKLASKLLRHLSHGLNSTAHEVEVRLLIPALSDLLNKDKVVGEMRINVLAALVALTDNQYDQVNSTVVLECPGLLHKLLALLQSNLLLGLELQQFALGVVENLCAASTAEQMQQIRETSFLNILKTYVRDPDSLLAHSACRCLVDHCELPDGLSAVMGAGFIPIVMNVAHKWHDDSSVHRVTSYVFLAALRTATQTQTLVLIHTGCWARLAGLFAAPKLDQLEVVELVSDAIRCVGQVMARFDSLADFDLAYGAMTHLVDGWMFLQALKTSACAEVRERAGELDMTVLRARLTGDAAAPMEEQEAFVDEQHQEVV